MNLNGEQLLSRLQNESEWVGWWQMCVEATDDVEERLAYNRLKMTYEQVFGPQPADPVTSLPLGMWEAMQATARHRTSSTPD